MEIGLRATIHLRLKTDATAMETPQKGAALIEIALVFPLFIAVMWATVGYGLPFFMLQTMNHAAEEAIRAAVRADPLQTSTAYRAKLVSLAQTRLDEKLAVLPDSMKTPLVRSVTVETISSLPTLVVRVTYPNYAQNPVIPVLVLPGIGRVPDLGGDLVAESRYRLESGG